MKLLLLADVDLTGHDASAVHVREAARGFSQLGIEVHLVTPSLPIKRGFWHYVRLGLNLLRALIRVRPDVVYEREIPSLLPVVLCVGRPLFLEINGDAVAESLDYRKPRIGLALAYLRFKLWVKYRCAAGLLPVASFLQRKLPAGKPVLVTRCGYSQSLVETERSERIVIGFVGSFRRWHRVDLLVRAFVACGRSDLELLLVGEGPELAGARAYLEEHSARYEAVGYQRELGPYLARMDYGYNYVTPGLNDELSNSKVKSYLSAGVSVVGNSMLRDGATLDFARVEANETVEGLAAVLSGLERPGATQRQVLSAAAASRFDWGATMRARLDFICRQMGAKSAARS